MASVPIRGPLTESIRLRRADLGIFGPRTLFRSKLDFRPEHQTLADRLVGGSPETEWLEVEGRVSERNRPRYGFGK